MLETNTGFWGMLGQTLFSLVMVCAVLWMVSRWILPRLNAWQVERHLIRVVDRIPLEPKKNLHVIQIGERFLLVATAENAVTVLSDVAPESVAEFQQHQVATAKKQLELTQNLNASQLFDKIAKTFKRTRIKNGEKTVSDETNSTI